MDHLIDDSDRLKPCPFCGGEATFDHDDNGWNWIECSACGATTNARVSAMDDCKPLLLEQWNKRVPSEVQPAPNFVDAYQGAMEEAAIWKKRALEAEDLNRKFVAEINGPTYMGEPAQPAPSVPEAVMRDAERYRYLRARDDGTAGVGCWIEADGRVCDRGWLNGDQLDSAIDSFIEVLAAAPKPEAKS